MKLCYVADNWAYFTPDFDNVTGSGWYRTPYEHNSGAPEGCHKVAWDGEFDAPCTGLSNSPYSVDRINAGVVPWLVTCRYASRPTVAIPAGIELSDFFEQIKRGGGNVYGRLT